MSSVYPWIYVDYTNNIWKFFKNDNKELRYNIMYREGKWTKENLIDKEVVGFAVYVDGDETIHIVYINIKGELRYCTIKEEQWVGKTLYQMDSDEFQIQNLKVEIIGEEMHIFYLLIANDGSDHGVLMHCIWNRKETKVSSIQDIILVPNLKEHYEIYVNKNSNIDMFFITDEGDEIALNYCIFEKHRWSTIKRLYGIQGDDISFKVLRDQQDIHILNKSREDSIYFLDHVCMDINGIIQEFRVHESTTKLVEPILFIESNKLYSCWLEQGKILYSGFDGEEWGSAVQFDMNDEHIVERYNCFIYCDKESSVKSAEVYGTNELDLCLFIPSQFVINIKEDTLKYGINQTNLAAFREEETIQSLKLQLSRTKLENKNLESKITSLNMQLQKKQKFMEEYEGRIARMLEQKRKADENYNIFLELQQNMQKELEVTKKKFSEEKMITANLKKELNEMKNQLTEAKDLIITLQKELEDTSQQLLEERNIKLNIEKKLEEYEEENVVIRKQLEIISEEKKKLYEELELEKNQSIMERLLRRRSSGI